jgi:hypothetical protein
VILCSVAFAVATFAQEPRTACETTAPPKFLLLVHQEFQAGKTAARRDLETEISRSSDRLKISLCWVEMEAMTGSPGALYFDSLDSFQQLEQAGGVWHGAVAKHAELARLLQSIEELLTSSKTVIAARRDDLGYRVDRIDLSKVRFMRIVIVRVGSGHENDFAELYKTLAATYEKINSPNPWMVYQVDSGIPRPTFLVIVPLRVFAEMDTLLANATAVRSAEGDAGAARRQEITRDAFTSTEVQLYAVSPQMSHVSPAFAAGDPAFWIQKPPPPPPAKKKQ